MELNELKRIWDRINELHSNPAYSPEQIQAFIKARSSDFTRWIRSALVLDLSLKLIITMASVWLITQNLSQLPVLLLVATMLISILFTAVKELRVLKTTSLLERSTGSVTEMLRKKVALVREMYHKVQFMQAITSPMLVAAGGLVYYQVKYGQVPPLDTKDLLVFSGFMILAFLLSLPSTLSMYGYHLKTLEDCLHNMDDGDHWGTQVEAFYRKRKVLYTGMIILLVAGIALLCLILLI